MTDQDCTTVQVKTLKIQERKSSELHSAWLEEINSLLQSASSFLVRLAIAFLHIWLDKARHLTYKMKYIQTQI